MLESKHSAIPAHLAQEEFWMNSTISFNSVKITHYVNSKHGNVSTLTREIELYFIIENRHYRTVLIFTIQKVTAFK